MKLAVPLCSVSFSGSAPEFLAISCHFLLLHPDKCREIASAIGLRQAVVLVFDILDDDSFSFLKAWEGFLSSVDPSIALCVANKADKCSIDAAKLDGKRDMWLEWCLDNGLEFIECSALCDQVGILQKSDTIIHVPGRPTPASLWKAAAKKIPRQYSQAFFGWHRQSQEDACRDKRLHMQVSGDSRDTEGVERVIEAIGSHTVSHFPNLPHPRLAKSQDDGVSHPNFPQIVLSYQKVHLS
jgi:hypothetical protein